MSLPTLRARRGLQEEENHDQNHSTNHRRSHHHGDRRGLNHAHVIPLHLRTPILIVLFLIGLRILQEVIPILLAVGAAIAAMPCLTTL